VYLKKIRNPSDSGDLEILAYRTKGGKMKKPEI
jgi:hypothetical protein